MWNFCVWALDPNVWGCSWALGKSCFSPVRDTKLNIEFVPDKSHFLQLPFPCQELPLPKVMQLRFLGICRGSWVVFGVYFLFGLLCVGFGDSGFFSCENSSCVFLFWIKPAQVWGNKLNFCY